MQYLDYKHFISEVWMFFIEKQLTTQVFEEHLLSRGNLLSIQKIYWLSTGHLNLLFSQLARKGKGQKLLRIRKINSLTHYQQKGPSKEISHSVMYWTKFRVAKYLDKYLDISLTDKIFTDFCLLKVFLMRVLYQAKLQQTKLSADKIAKVNDNVRICRT